MFAAKITDLALAVSVVLLFLLILGVYNYLSSSCVLYLTGESFSISNCPINSDLADLVREQRELLSCGLR
uniref:Movement protein TGBp3 n=1 Tax=Okra mild mottle virus TaxID=3161050 RepID=A0AAU7LL51_9VIRU